MRAIILLMLLALWPATARAQSGDKMHQFRGIPLGITLDEFRQIPHPDRPNRNYRIICSGETRKPEGEPSEVWVSEQLKSAGLPLQQQPRKLL